MNKKVLSVITIVSSLILSQAAVAAVPNYKVNMRVGIKGSSPISVNTVAKPGKKSFVSQFSDDGTVETLISMVARRSEQNNKKGLSMDVQVTRRVRGQEKVSENARIFAPDNEEMEFGINSKGRTTEKLSIAVMAHKL